MPKRPKKLFFFVDASEYLYCVASRDVITAGDATSVAVDEEISFHYGRLVLKGIVRLISNNEDEILSAIKKEKKRMKKKERSFHAELKRPSKFRKTPQDLADQATVKNPEPSNLVSKTSAKREREVLKSKARNVTEGSLIESHTETKNVIDKDNGDVDGGCSMLNRKESNGDLEISLKNVTSPPSTSGPSDDERQERSKSSTSDSSLDPTRKVDDRMKRKDINLLQDESSSSAPHSPEGKSLTISSLGEVSHRSIENSADEPGNLNCEGGEQERKENSPAVEDSPNRPSNDSNDVSTEELLLDEADDDNRKARKKSRKRRHRSSSSSSTSSSSSSSDTSSSDTSSSSSSEEEEKRRKRRKKSKKRRSRKSKKLRVKKKGTKVTRNMTVFPGENFKWKEKDPGVTKVHNEFDIYMLKTDLEQSLQQAKSPQTFIKMLVGYVFTPEALAGSTAQGYPPRNIGRKKLRQKDVLPRIDPDGRRAIIRRAEDLETEKKSWRPKIGSSSMNQAFTAAVGSYTTSADGN